MIRRILQWPCALPAILAVALAIRLLIVFTQTYTVFYDETFQYLEQAHRLVFGAGVLPWEFQDGIRSWLLPGLVAGVFWLMDHVTSDPLTLIRAVRVLCVVASLAVVFVGYRWAERVAGPGAALLTGGLCAVWFDLLWFAPAVMPEVLAAHCALLAVWQGELARGRPPPTGEEEPDFPWYFPPFRAGVLFGLAFCLRYQYAPALLAAALWQYRLRWSNWRWVLNGGLLTVVPIAGVLDWLTWDSPFRSIILNFQRNSLEGVSAGMGTEPASFFLSYLLVGLWPLPVLGGLAVIGSLRAPALGLMALVTLLLHSAVPHKEVRFIYLALAAAPILIGLGVSTLLRMEARRAMAGALAVFALLSWHTGSGPLGARWQFQRAVTQAFLSAHDEPSLCGLAVRDMRFYQSGGYAWLHRDAPLYFDDFQPALTVPGSSVPLRLDVILRGRSVPQFPGPALAQATAHYTHMIAEPGHAPPGYAEVACFSDATRTVPLCLFRRPGSCS